MNNVDNRNRQHTSNPNRMHRRRAKRRNAFIKALIIILIIGVAIFIGLRMAKQKTVEVASETILEQIIREQVKSEYMKEKEEKASSSNDFTTTVNENGEILLGERSELSVTDTGKSDHEIIDERVQKVLNKIEKDDKEVIEEIVADHLNADLIKDAISYLERGDIDGLEERAKSELSQSEIDRLKSIYEKYKDDF